MPSRAVTSFLLCVDTYEEYVVLACQCPHGLLPHFYKGRYIDPRDMYKLCQCPHGLLPHFYEYTYSGINR